MESLEEGPDFTESSKQLEAAEKKKKKMAVQNQILLLKFSVRNLQ